MPRRERQKGQRGEREVRDLLRKYGFKAERDGRLDDDLQHNVPNVHFEVKRCERIEIGKWTLQALADAGIERVPVVCYRTSNDVWRASLPLEALLELYELRRICCFSPDVK